MNKTLQTQLKTYYKEIANTLVCEPRVKKNFLKSLQGDIEEFVQMQPDTVFADIQQTFGTPAQIANSFLGTVTDSTAVKKKLTIKRIFLTAVFIALVVYVAFIVISLLDVHTEAHGYFRESILMFTLLPFFGGAK